MKDMKEEKKRNKKPDGTTEQSFHARLSEQKRLAREKAAKAAQLSWEKQAKDFLESDSFAAQATKVALALTVVAGVLTALSVAPGLTVLARQYQRSKYYSAKQIQDATRNLKKRHYIETDTSRDKPRMRLTKKGEAYFQKIIFEEARLSSKEKWDGKWRFVLFDVPVNHSKARDALRWRLRALGFFQYQKSVWAYPYPCKNEILFVADYYGIGRFVEILDATGLSDDAALKKYFELP